MNSIKKLIQEKLKINSKSKIFTGGGDYDEDLKFNFFTEIQNESNKEGEYHTFDYNKGQSKYKKGFIITSEDDECVIIQGCNSCEDFARECGWTTQLSKKMDDLNIQECINNPNVNGKIIRIW